MSAARDLGHEWQPLLDARPDLPGLDRRPDGPTPDRMRDTQADRSRDLSLAKTDASPCKPPCSGSSPICCLSGDGFSCVSSLDKCTCDIATGAPCDWNNVYPICCDKGTGPVCQGDALNCACDPQTGNPCVGSFSKCCAQAGTFRCLASCN